MAVMERLKALREERWREALRMAISRCFSAMEAVEIGCTCSLGERNPPVFQGVSTFDIVA